MVLAHVSSEGRHWGTQRMPPPRYCFGLLFSDLIDRLLFKTHQKFKMAESARRALEECSELSYLNIGEDELIYVEASHDSPLWDRMCLVYYACAVSNLV